MLGANLVSLLYRDVSVTRLVSVFKKRIALYLTLVYVDIENTDQTG